MKSDSREEQASRLRALANARGYKKAADLSRALGTDELAESTVRSLLNGQRQLTRDSAEQLARFLRAPKAWLLYGEGTAPSGLGSDEPTVELSDSERSQQSVASQNRSGIGFLGRHLTGVRDLPIRGHTKAGKAGFFIDQGETWGFAMRPESLKGLTEAYAVRVHDTSMEPRFKPGNVLQVDPFRRPEPGDNVIVQLKDGQAFVKELVRRAGRVVICRQFNPAETVDYKPSDVLALHLVVGIDFLER